MSTACRTVPMESTPLIIGGIDAKPDQFPSVVAIKNSEGRVICSGTLIGSKAALTAHHCIGKDLTIQGKRPTHALVHKAYNEEDLGNLDVAVLLFDSNFSGPFSRIKEEPVPKSTVFTVVGYGCSSPGDRKSAGVKRYGTQRISNLGEAGEIIYYESGEDNPPGVNVATCKGDSGGPLFVGEDVIGVTSGIDSRFYFASGTFTRGVKSMLKIAQDQGAGIPNLKLPALQPSDLAEVTREDF